MKPEPENDPRKQQEKQDGPSADKDVHHDESRHNDFDPEVADDLGEGEEE